MNTIKVALICVIAATVAGCEPPPRRFAVCVHKSTGHRAVGRRWLDEIRVKDANGIARIIDATNSDQWKCVDRVGQ